MNNSLDMLNLKDTYCVLFRHKKGVMPIQTGQHLGEMSQEYAEFEIKTFASGGLFFCSFILVILIVRAGAKQYALRLLEKTTKKEVFVQKIRGITFDVENEACLKFNRFVNKVLDIGREAEPAVFHYSKIQPTKDCNVVTREQAKRYLPVCQKGIITEQYDVLPFGYE